jgi:uncharacterized protein YrrD
MNSYKLNAVISMVLSYFSRFVLLWFVQKRFYFNDAVHCFHLILSFGICNIFYDGIKYGKG